jgi:uncharacterized protein YxjI
MSEQYDWPRQFVARRAFFNFLGVRFRIYTGNKLAFFVKQKAFKLKEEITVYADEAQTQPRLQIQARSIIDFSATYDVTDVQTGENVGALQRQGMKSLLRDEWHILDSNGTQVAVVKEDSGMLALVRRFLFNLIPQTFVLSNENGDLGKMKQRFNPFINVYDVDLRPTENKEFNPRLGIAAAVLLLAIEGRQK